MASQDQAQQFDLIGINGISGFYFQNLEQLTGKLWIPDIANEFTSSQDTETYAGIGMVPQLREWVGGKQPHSFIESSIKISNLDWESTIEIKNKDRRRDKTGQLSARMGQLAERALAHDAKLLSYLINGGTSTSVSFGTATRVVSCYDSQPLFSASHKVGSQALNNIVSVSLSGLPLGTAVSAGTTTQPSVAAMAYAIQYGVQQIFAFVDDQGEPINEFANKFTLMVPVSFGGVAQAAIAAMYPGIGLSNNLMFVESPAGTKMEFRVVTNPRLTWTNQFAIFRSDAPFKALISQLEVAPILKMLAEGSDYEFDNNAIKVSVEKSGNVGYGRFDQTVLVQLAS